MPESPQVPQPSVTSYRKYRGYMEKYPGLNLLLLLGSTYLPYYYKTTKIPYLIYYIQFISSTATTSHVPTISTKTIMKIPKHLYSQIVTLLNTLLYSTQIKKRTEPFGTPCFHPSLLLPDKIQKDDTWDLFLDLVRSQ